MLESVADTISGPDSDTIAWSHSRAEIVDGVEDLFAALNPQRAEDQRSEDEKWRDLMDALKEFIKTLGEVAGEEVAWPVAVGIALLFIELFAIAEPYREAAIELKRRRATSGFMVGLAMGVLRETPDNARDYFWEESPENYPGFEESGRMAQTYYNGGIALGFMQGTNVALKGLGTAFWKDLRKQVSGPQGDPDDGWGRIDWINFYIAAGVAFDKGHITE